MSRPYVRHEWVDPPRVLLDASPQEPVTLANFAYEQSAAVLDAEPALVTLAALVERAKPTGEEWRGVDRIASTLVGPRRSIVQTTAVDASYVAVRATVNGETTFRRYLEVLRGLAA